MVRHEGYDKIEQQYHQMGELHRKKNLDRFADKFADKKTGQPWIFLKYD